jgi:hypothetical protein
VAEQPRTPGEPAALRVVLTLRSRSLDDLITPDNAAQLNQAVWLLKPMRPEKLREAIVRPAESAGLAFEVGLLDTILHDCPPSHGTLSLLSEVLHLRNDDGTVLASTTVPVPRGLSFDATGERFGLITGREMRIYRTSGMTLERAVPPPVPPGHETFEPPDSSRASIVPGPSGELLVGAFGVVSSWDPTTGIQTAPPLVLDQSNPRREESRRPWFSRLAPNIPSSCWWRWAGG